MNAVVAEGDAMSGHTDPAAVVGFTGLAVVVPTLGRLSLERAIGSVASQSLLPQELLLVANGAERIDPDRVNRLIAIADSVPLKIISLPPFSGPSICRNVGAWESQNPYVAFLDDDDVLAPDYLSLMSEEIARSQPEILYGAKVWRNSDGSIRRQKRLTTVPQGQWFERLYRQENPGFGGTNVIIQRDAFFELGGFAVDLPSGEDRALAMAALRAGKRFSYVDAAEVSCHDPEGYRANQRSDKWLTNLKIIREYWGDVSRRSRLRSLWRVFRSFIRA